MENIEMELLCYQKINFPDEKTGKIIRGIKVFLFEAWDKAPATAFVEDAVGIRDDFDDDNKVRPLFKLSGKRVKIADLVDKKGKTIFEFAD